MTSFKELGKKDAVSYTKGENPDTTLTCGADDRDTVGRDDHGRQVVWNQI